MPKKKKTTAKATVKKVQAKTKKISKASKAKHSLVVSKAPVVTKISAKAPRPSKISKVTKVSRAKTQAPKISHTDQIIHAAETYAVSIDEIISAGNREFRMMQTNGRGREITAPKEAKHIEAAMAIEIDEVQEEVVAPESTLSNEDQKALAAVREKLESSTVMIRSVSPLQSSFAHSSQSFVKESPRKASKAPLVFLSSAAIVFAAFVVAIVVSKSGSILPSPVSAPKTSEAKVAGAEVSPQLYVKTGAYQFLYPLTWFASNVKDTVTVADGPKTALNTVTVTSTSLNGKTFAQWFAANKNYKGKQLKVGVTGILPTYQIVETDASKGTTVFIDGKDKVITVHATAGDAAKKTLDLVVSSFKFSK